MNIKKLFGRKFRNTHYLKILLSSKDSNLHHRSSRHGVLPLHQMINEFCNTHDLLFYQALFGNLQLSFHDLLYAFKSSLIDIALFARPVGFEPTMEKNLRQVNSLLPSTAWLKTQNNKWTYRDSNPGSLRAKQKC